jgi:diacylglycerol kinase
MRAARVLTSALSCELVVIVELLRTVIEHLHPAIRQLDQAVRSHRS